MLKWLIDYICSIFNGADNMDTTQQALDSRGDLATLLCGAETQDKAEIDEVLDYLADSLDRVFLEVLNLKNKDDKAVGLYGPFLGRSILELGCTALIARLDPFRVLLLRERQKQPSFVLDKPHKSSIRWQGDIMPDGKIENLWEEKHLQNPTRALLGDYYANLIWPGSVDKVLDALTSSPSGVWTDKLRQSDSGSLCPRIRGDLSKLYSSLSKGIHHELVIPLSSSFDRVSVVDYLSDSLYNVATLGLITHAVRHCYNTQELPTMVSVYERLQVVEVR